MRCVQVWVLTQSIPRPLTLGAVISDGESEHRCIHNDHRVSRSFLMASTTAVDESRAPPRRSIRRKTSSTVGFDAASFTRLNRYSCSDMPAASARRRRMEWVFSGTLRICMFIACILHALLHKLKVRRCRFRVTTDPGRCRGLHVPAARRIRSDGCLSSTAKCSRATRRCIGPEAASFPVSEFEVPETNQPSRAVEYVTSRATRRRRIL